MKKLVLIPESKYIQLSEHSETKNSNSILQAVKRPEQQEMIKKYNLAQSIMNDTKPNDEKISEYNDTMGDFTVLRDRVKSMRVPKSIVDKATSDSVNMMPATLQSNAQKLMNRIKEDESGVITWSPKGEVSIHGQRLPGTTITDLVGDVIRSTKTEMPERDQFLSALAELNTPETLIRNRVALTQYRKMKNRGFRPPGIPDVQFKEDEEESPARKKKKKIRANKMQQMIDWENT